MKTNEHHIQKINRAKSEKKRKAWDLINEDIPYKDMTEEEIADVVEVKAEIIARDTTFQEIAKSWKEKEIKMVEQNKKIIDNMQKDFKASLKRMEDDSKNNVLLFEKSLNKIEEK